MHFQADMHMKVVLLHWFDDGVKLRVGGLPMKGMGGGLIQSI
jgi:hypothetical protein